MGKCCLHFKELDDLELTSVAKVIGMSTPKESIAYYKRVKGLPSRAAALSGTDVWFPSEVRGFDS
jgi:hypothetical protein